MFSMIFPRGVGFRLLYVRCCMFDTVCPVLFFGVSLTKVKDLRIREPYSIWRTGANGRAVTEYIP